MKAISVLTLARGRAEHLANMLIGLREQKVLPYELLIAVMQSEPYRDLPKAPFPVRQIPISAHESLPLARARNIVARNARGNYLVFFDIDCIPHPLALYDYGRALQRTDGLFMGDVRYLPAHPIRRQWTFAELESLSEQHSDRQPPFIKDTERCSDYRCFWSLNFAMHRQTFFGIGGFDERYVGYGGEDTDFGKAFVTRGGHLAWLRGGRTYHQYHPHHMPPVHHLESVVRNAQIFETKWGYRTMGHWLHAFRLMGLVDDTPGRPIRILREPNEADFTLTRQKRHQAYANAATVIRALEEGNPQAPSNASVAP